MAGIQVHTASPINTNAAAKPDGTTPSTARQQDGPVSAPTTATTAVTPTSTTTAAQPGREAIPAPTGTATSTYTPTPTVPPTTTTSDSPPPPQPGAVPSPFISQPAALNTARRPSIPAPPRAGEVPKPAAYYAPQYSDTQQTASPSTYNPPPPLPSYQTNGTISTPTRAQPPAATTSTYTGLHPIQQTDLSNPPGYVQNSRASFDERPFEPYSPFTNANNNTPNYRGHKARPSMSGGLLDDSPDSKRDDEGEEKSVWDTGVSWLKKAGEKLGEAHDEVWRRIDGDK